jgi:hypothetical protein
MENEKNTRNDNVMQVSSMQEGMQEASLSPELGNLSEAERSGSDADKTDALNSARVEIDRKVSMAKTELAEVQASAERRGEPAPQITANLDINTGTMDARDLAMAEQSVSQAQQSINGAQGQQMLRNVAEAAGLLAALGVVGGQNVSESALFNGVSGGAGLPGLQEDKDRSAMLS